MNKFKNICLFRNPNSEIRIINYPRTLYLFHSKQSLRYVKILSGRLFRGLARAARFLRDIQHH
jgi:hypothetical protein